jgi:hypothetical protein
MKRPTAASLKKVTAENLAGLGAERLAAILISSSEGRPELKRRLKMELAAEQGPEHLVVEIDKRIATLETSRSKVSWRQRATFVRDVDTLRELIAARLGKLDPAEALRRLWPFMALAPRLTGRVKDKDGELDAVFATGAGDIGLLLAGSGDPAGGEALIEAMARSPARWADWLPEVLKHTAPEVAKAALQALGERQGAPPGWVPIIRLLADAAGDADAFHQTFTAEALRSPGIAALVARRLLAGGRVREAGAILAPARPDFSTGVGAGQAAGPGFDWESAWIDYLERAGEAATAQETRWASFERTLSEERAKAFTRRLPDFDDVEAEARAFDHAATHADFRRGLRFLMDWPAMAEAARMIEARAEEVETTVEQAEQWADRLRQRWPRAAHILLRKAAAGALRRRDVVTSARLTQEADALLAE